MIGTYVERADTDEFSVAGVLIAVWDGPLQWKEVGVVDLDVFSAVPCNRLLLGETDTAVLQRGEDGRRHIVIVTLRSTHTDIQTYRHRET